MELIDDDGNLFGVVNVVDALVVLLVVAVITAGVMFVFADDPAPEPETATTYATLDLGTQPDYIVSAINEGDTYNPDDSSQLRITDVHLTPQHDNVRVLLRVELTGEVTDESLTYANAPPRLGRTLGISTDLYEVDGQIRAVGESDTLATESTTVILRQTMNADEADAVTSGDEIRVGGRTVATIEDVAAYATNDPTQRRVFVAANLTTHRQQDDWRFGGVPVNRGQQIVLPTAEYTIRGTIERIGGDLQLGEPTRRTVTLRMNEVNADIADSILPGMTERVGDRTVARVTEVETEPSLIIATGEDGSLNVADHPTDREVTLTADLLVRETSSGTQFKAEPIRVGSRVTLDLGTVTVEATVINVGE
ncbi:DUF4330 family protein [Halobellus rarus]|uniref:DUF4330 family protein n=1 Tax=Halobellus rarus TaxID=1126237 RepID=A0ABD6CK84_9EURY|nr:DUF4330 family protein [Halobellus rarus]